MVSLKSRRYNDGHIRADLSWVWFLCSIGFMLYDYFTTQTMINDMKWAISVDWGLEKSWNQHLSFSWMLWTAWVVLSGYQMVQ